MIFDEFVPLTNVQHPNVHYSKVKSANAEHAMLEAQLNELYERNRDTTCRGRAKIAEIHEWLHQLDDASSDLEEVADSVFDEINSYTCADCVVNFKGVDLSGRSGSAN